MKKKLSTPGRRQRKEKVTKDISAWVRGGLGTFCSGKWQNAEPTGCTLYPSLAVRKISQLNERCEQ